MKVSCFSSISHYCDHLWALWQGLPDHIKGDFYVHHLLSDTGHKVGIPPVSDAIIVAGHLDMVMVGGGRKMALLEHGAGQTYLVPNSDPNPSNPGGADRGGISLFLHPNEQAAAMDRRVYPKARIAVVGSPRLDALTELYNGLERPTATSKPTIGLTFHWPSNLCQESRWALPHYEQEFPMWGVHYKVLAHAHPRIYDRIASKYEAAGFTLCPRFEQLFEADLLALDNSSAGPEWAAITGKPLMWMNAPWYKATHGKRFWEWTQGQVTIDGPWEWDAGIEKALEDPWVAKTCRQNMVKDTYSQRGSAAKLAAEAIEAWLQED